MVSLSFLSSCWYRRLVSGKSLALMFLYCFRWGRIVFLMYGSVWVLYWSSRRGFLFLSLWVGILILSVWFSLSWMKFFGVRVSSSLIRAPVR